MKPIYTTKVEHSQIAKPATKKRRRIGQMGERLKSELNELDKHTQIAMKIAVGMQMINLLNQ